MNFRAIYDDINRLTFPYQAVAKLANALESRKVDELNLNVRLEERTFHDFF